MRTFNILSIFLVTTVLLHHAQSQTPPTPPTPPSTGTTAPGATKATTDYLAIGSQVGANLITSGKDIIDGFQSGSAMNVMKGLTPAISALNPLVGAIFGLFFPAFAGPSNQDVIDQLTKVVETNTKKTIDTIVQGFVSTQSQIT